MGEGLAVLASSLDTMRTMASRDIDETGFDEDIQTDSSTNPCPECDGHVTTNVKETVCEDCDLVIEEQRLDHGQEWRAYEEDEWERTGAPLTATRSGTLDRDRPQDRREGERAPREEATAARPNVPRANPRSAAVESGTEIHRIACALDLPESIRDQACALYRSATSEDLLRGRSIEAVAAAGVYAACRCNALPRTLPVGW